MARARAECTPGHSRMLAPHWPGTKVYDLCVFVHLLSSLATVSWPRSRGQGPRQARRQ